METGIVKLTPELLAIFSGTENSNSLMPFTREIFLLDIVVAGRHLLLRKPCGCAAKP